MLRTLKFGIFSTVILFAFLGSAYSEDTTLQWVANSTPVDGYKIHYHTSSGPPYQGWGAQEGDSPIEITVCNDENPDPEIVEYTVHDLPDGTYYFAVTSYIGAVPPVESDYSNEISNSGGNEISDSGGSEVSGGGGGSSGGCFIFMLALK